MRFWYEVRVRGLVTDTVKRFGLLVLVRVTGKRESKR